jgi:hypothetical protein
MEIPASCTLPSSEQPMRVRELETLLATAIAWHRPEPRHLRVTFAGGESTWATVRDLVALESACCSFFAFTVTTGDDRVVLDVRVPTGQVGVLDGLAALAGGEARTH